MQADNDIQKLMRSDSFQLLLQKKKRMIFFLSLLMLLVYSFYFVALAWFPEWMGSRLMEQSVISIGIWLTIICVLFSIFISGFYIWWANNRFDAILQRFLRDTSHVED